MAVAGFEPLDFHAFHRRELPERLAAGNGALAAPAVQRLGSLALRMPDGEAYTYRAVEGGIAIEPGEASADTVVELGHEAWEGLVHDYESAPGLLYGGHVRCHRGKAIRLVAWEPGLRAMYGGRPIFDPGSQRLEDRHGQPLDPEQTFRLGDDRDDMAHFLRTAGYLLVRGVFAAGEVEGLLAEARELRGEAAKGDKLSWWGRNRRGEEILCRVTRAAAKPGLRRFASDPRLLELVALSDEKLIPRTQASLDETVTVIYKQPGMGEGLSDLPWHRDCGMGGHAVMCPILLASLYLTPARPETGELKFLPGSWNASTPYMDPNHAKAPPGARFRAEPGDVSLHYGDVMHAAPPPTREDLDQYRMSAVTAFTRPGYRNHRGASTYNDVLHQREDGQIEHLEKVAERVRS